LKTVITQRMTGDLRTQLLADFKSALNVSPLLVSYNSGCSTDVSSSSEGGGLSSSQQQQQQQQPTATLERHDYNLIQAIQAAQRSFVLTDPSLPDNPIIFASKGFLELTGYKLEDILGRNCRFLQGPKTDQEQKRILRDGIERGEDTSVLLMNYRADGTEFYNQVFVAALRDSDNRIINYVGVQVEVKRTNYFFCCEIIFSLFQVNQPNTESTTSSTKQPSVVSEPEKLMPQLISTKTTASRKRNSKGAKKV
jgi:PAS domain S-box-containing protein